MCTLCVTIFQTSSFTMRSFTEFIRHILLFPLFTRLYVPYSITWVKYPSKIWNLNVLEFEKSHVQLQLALTTLPWIAFVHYSVWETLYRHNFIELNAMWLPSTAVETALPAEMQIPLTSIYWCHLLVVFSTSTNDPYSCDTHARTHTQSTTNRIL
jgi:hypothetical protein